VHPQTPSRILRDCFVARKGKKRRNGLGRERDKQGEKEGRGIKRGGRKEGKEGECNVAQ